MEADLLDDEFITPNASRVAARAMILSAVMYRGLLDLDVDQQQSEERRRHLCEWLDGLGVAGELEDGENAVIRTPIRLLDRQRVTNATWRSEGMLILAWSLGRTELPRYYDQCDPFDVATSLGFFAERDDTALARPSLRPPEEIEHCAGTYLTIHWRLSEFRIIDSPIDFASLVSHCEWAPLTLDGVELIDGDLGIRSERIDRAPADWLRQTMSITRERHKALNWLLGFDPIYSNTSTDT